MARPDLVPIPDAEGTPRRREPPPSMRDALEATIRRLLVPGMGVLGADESAGTIGRRFEPVGVRSTEESRRSYRELPPAVPGVVFLSGGQTPAEATAHLAAMNAAGPHPWVLSSSFSRAIQDSVLETSRGDHMNIAAAQAVFAERARESGVARSGNRNGGAR